MTVGEQLAAARFLRDYAARQDEAAAKLENNPFGATLADEARACRIAAQVLEGCAACAGEGE